MTYGIKTGSTAYMLSEHDLKNNMFIGFLFLIGTSILTTIVVPLSKFRFTKRYGVVLLLIYAAFSAMSFLTEFRVIWPNTEIWDRARLR